MIDDELDALLKEENNKIDVMHESLGIALEGKSSKKKAAVKIAPEEKIYAQAWRQTAAQTVDRLQYLIENEELNRKAVIRKRDTIKGQLIIGCICLTIFLLLLIWDISRAVKGVASDASADSAISGVPKFIMAFFSFII